MVAHLCVDLVAVTFIVSVMLSQITQVLSGLYSYGLYNYGPHSYGDIVTAFIVSVMFGQITQVLSGPHVL